MAKSGTPLGIGLAIDFAQLDKDLGKVADKIEGVGKDVSLKVGTLAGAAAKGDIKGEQLQAQVAQIGVALSTGMASGVRASSALILGLGARMNSMLDSLAGTAITMFKRIDAAMKFPLWDTALARAENRFSHFFRVGKVGMSNLDKAMGGGMGKIAQMAAKILVPLFEDLGKKIGEQIGMGIKSLIPIVQQTASEISKSMTDAAVSMSTNMTAAIKALSSSFQGLGKIILQTNADADKLGATMTAAYRKFGKFPEEKPKKALIAGFPRDIGATRAAQEAMFEPAPAKPEFRGARPAPQMGKGYAQVFRESIAYAKAFQQALGSLRDPAIILNEHIKNIPKSMGQTIKASEPFQFVARALSGAAAGAVGLIRAYRSVANVVSSLGQIHKQTYSKIFADHNLFIASSMAVYKSVVHIGRGLLDLVTLRAFRRVGDDAASANKNIKATGSSIGKLIGSVTRLGLEMTAALGFIGIGYKIVQFFTGGTKAAAELNATTNRTKMVFGETFGAVNEQAEKLARVSGTTKASQLELAASFGAMAQGAGVGEKKAAEMSMQLTALATDFTALGIPIEEAGEAIKTGLSGRAISLKQFGAQIDETTTKTYALKHGLLNTREGLNAQATFAARAGLVMQGLGYIQGALAKGANTASVQFQRAGGGIALFAEKVGEALMPAIKMGTVGFNTLLGGILDLMTRGAPVISSWVASVSDAINSVIALVKDVGPAIVENITWAWEEAKQGPLSFVTSSLEWMVDFAAGVAQLAKLTVRYPQDMWKIATLEVGAFVENTIRWISTMPENFSRILNWIGSNWHNLLVDMGSFFMTVGNNIITNAVNLGQAIWAAIQGQPWELAWTPLLKGFEAVTEKLPEMIRPDLIDVSKEVQSIWDEISKKEFKRPKLLTTAPEAEFGKGKFTPPETAQVEHKLGGALEMGSKEAFSAISRGVLTGRESTTSAVKEGVKVQRDIHAAVKEQTATMKERMAKMIEVK